MARGKIGPTVDLDIWNEFKQFVKDKYGFTRGVLGSELDKALKNHINQGKTRVTTTDNQPVTDQVSMIENPNAHTHTPAPGKYDEFLVSFENEFNDKKEITKTQIEHFIMNKEQLTHPQTIKQRIKLLIGNGLIESIGDGIYKNVLVSELSENSSTIKVDSYNLVLSYIDSDLNGEKIPSKKIPKLPKHIQKALNDIDYEDLKELLVD